MQATDPQLDPHVVTTIVRQATHRDRLVLDAWRVEPVDYLNLNPAYRALYRVSGTAHDRGTPVPWSLILKTFKAPTADASDDPGQPFYWKREPLAYQSGLLPTMAAGLAAPASFGITERPDREIWLWLEDLGTADDSPWPLSRYGLAARHMGAFGGISAAHHPDTSVPWLSRGMIKAWIADSESLIERVQRPGVWEHSLLRAAFPTPPAEEIVRLWNEHDRLCAALERLPGTLCHHDLWRKNVFSRQTADGHEQTVAIDWEVAGWGALGEDVGNLFGVSLLNFDVEVDQAVELEALIFHEYLAGLREAGWDGDVQAVRAAFVTAAALRCIFSTACWPVAITLDTSNRYIAETEARWKRPIEQIFRQWAAVTRLLLSRADEARTLLRDLV
ncbi:MAG TPA: phosphotransferase [Herpetosiphonaceae bacterium]